MKNTLYLISNEKIFQNNEMFFCDNLDMKSTPEGLSKHFNIKIIARKSKVSRSQKIDLKNIKTFSNIFSYIFEVVKLSKQKESKFLIISLTPFTFLAGILLILSGLLITAYTFNQMYLTNSKQEIAQEKLAAIYNGEKTLDEVEEVFATESKVFNLREIFNDTPIFDNFMNQVLPENNVVVNNGKPDIFGYLEISSINVKQYVLTDTSENTLELGPGHYSGTALPGTGGNVGIAGHRTTYGAPFGNLDAVVIGDEIQLTVDSSTYYYKVDSIDIVDAVGGEYVLFNRGDDRLTLTTCHPKYSAKERLIVSGILTKIETVS